MHAMGMLVVPEVPGAPAPLVEGAQVPASAHSPAPPPLLEGPELHAAVTIPRSSATRAPAKSDRMVVRRGLTPLWTATPPEM